MESPGQEDTAPIQPEWPSYCDPDYIMPNSMSVSVKRQNGTIFKFDISIEKTAEKNKPYLGGYRHKGTGFVYHHASSQTPAGLDKRIGWINPENKTHRDTQTYDMKTRSQMTVREHGTQMQRKDLRIDDSHDKMITPKVYFTAAQRESLVKEKTLIIQCYYRGYKARHHTWNVREGLYVAYLDEQKLEDERKQEEEKRQRYEVERRLRPKTKEDFSILYNELHEWKDQQITEAKSSNLSDKELKARLREIVIHQAKALKNISDLKGIAGKHSKDKRVMQLLDAMAMPKKWEMGNGEVQEISTVSTERAALLRDLYHGLNDANAQLDTRLDVLLRVKWTVQEHDCVLTRDIVDLCDREAEMLNRGRNGASVAGLRKRISNLFLQFLETPEFNPEVARFLEVKQDDEGSPKASSMMRRSQTPP